MATPMAETGPECPPAPSARRSHPAENARGPANWLCFADRRPRAPVSLRKAKRRSNLGPANWLCFSSRPSFSGQKRGKLGSFGILGLSPPDACARKLALFGKPALSRTCVIARSEATRQSRPEGLALFGIFAPPAPPSVPTDSTRPLGAASATLRPPETSNAPRLKLAINATKRGMNSATESTCTTLGSHIGWCA